MAATKIAASTGVSAARYGRSAGCGSACPITKRPAGSSRDLPGGALFGILDHDAHRCELVADAIGLLEVLSRTGSGASLNQRANFNFAWALPGDYAIAVDLATLLAVP